MLAKITHKRSDREAFLRINGQTHPPIPKCCRGWQRSPVVISCSKYPCSSRAQSVDCFEFEKKGFVPAGASTRRLAFARRSRHRSEARPPASDPAADRTPPRVPIAQVVVGEIRWPGQPWTIGLALTREIRPCGQRPWTTWWTSCAGPQVDHRVAAHFAHRFPGQTVPAWCRLRRALLLTFLLKKISLTRATNREYSQRFTFSEEYSRELIPIYRPPPVLLYLRWTRRAGPSSPEWAGWLKFYGRPSRALSRATTRFAGCADIVRQGSPCQLGPMDSAGRRPHKTGGRARFALRRDGRGALPPTSGRTLGRPASAGALAHWRPPPPFGDQAWGPGAPSGGLGLNARPPAAAVRSAHFAAGFARTGPGLLAASGAAPPERQSERIPSCPRSPRPGRRPAPGCQGPFKAPDKLGGSGGPTWASPALQITR